MMDLREAELAEAAADLDQSMLEFLPRAQASATYTRVSKATLDLGGSGASVGTLNPGQLSVGPCPGGSGTCVLDSGGQPAVAAAFSFPQPPRDFFSLEGSLSVPISDYILNLHHARKGSLAQIQSSKYLAVAEQRKTESNAQIAFYNWLRVKAQVAVAEQSLERINARLADARAGFEAGILSKVDLMRMETVLAQGEAALVKARAFESLARDQIAVQIGDPIGTSYTVGEDVFAADLPAFAANKEAGSLAKIAELPLPDLVARAQQQRVDFKALGASLDAIEHGSASAKSRYFPRLDAFASGTYANPNQRFFPLEQVWNGSWAAGVSLTWVFNQAAMAYAMSEKLDAQASKVRAQRSALLQGVAMEVAAAHADHHSARSSIEHYDRAASASEEAYRVAGDLFRAGESTATDMIESESERVASTLARVNARIDLRVAALRLLYATGDLHVAEARHP
jgi:outer membrane protein TolC